MKYELAIDTRKHNSNERFIPILFETFGLTSEDAGAKTIRDIIGSQKNNKPEEKELISIVEFTTLFDDMDDLKNTLNNAGIKTGDYDIVIVKSKENEQTRLPNKIPFKNDLWFYEFSNLARYITSNKKDYNLIFAIKEKFDVNFIKSKKYKEYYRYIDYYTISDGYMNSFDDLNINEIIYEYLKLLIFRRNKNLNSIGSIQFSILHTLAMIAANHNHKLNPTNKPHELNYEEKSEKRLEHIRFLLTNDNLLPEERSVLESEEYEILWKLNLLESEVRRNGNTRY